MHMGSPQHVLVLLLKDALEVSDNPTFPDTHPDFPVRPTRIGTAFRELFVQSFE
jgi:hypothetical protein